MAFKNELCEKVDFEKNINSTDERKKLLKYRLHIFMEIKFLTTAGTVNAKQMQMHRIYKFDILSFSFKVE